MFIRRHHLAGDFARKALLAVALGACGHPPVEAAADGGGVEVIPRAPFARESNQRPRECPSTTAEWTSRRDQLIGVLLMPRMGEKGLWIDSDQVGAQSIAISDFLDDCAGDDHLPHEIDAVIGNLRQFTRIQRNAMDHRFHQFGHGGPSSSDQNEAPSTDHPINDFEYLDRVRENVDLPWLLKSSDFLDKVSRPKTYRDARDIILKHNQGLKEEDRWIVLLYKSRFLPTPDTAATYGRFFVLVPGEHFDKWIQFGMQVPDDPQQMPRERNERLDLPVNNLSIVSISKDNAHSGDPQFNALIDWWRIYSDGYKVRLETRRESQGVTGNCLECHKASPLGIHPKMVYRFDDEGHLVPELNDPDTIPDELNRRIEGYGPPVITTGKGDEFADPSGYGPELGRVTDQRSPEFMKACTAPWKLNSSSIENVEAVMNCAACHSTAVHGILNFPQATNINPNIDPPAEDNLVYHYIVNAWMPPAAEGYPSLMPNEREALFNCLMQEYYDPGKGSGLFVEWLKNKIGPNDAGNRKAAFTDQCSGCHSHSVPPAIMNHGPSLAGVYGRRAGSVSGYGYSPGLKAAGALGILWDETTLPKFLTDPSTFIRHATGKDTKMAKKLPDPALQRSIIEYLKTLK
jgi:cytochrome c2